MRTDDEHKLEKTKYESVRLRAGMSTVWSPERKLRWCGYLLLSTSSLAPIVIALPDRVRTEYLGGSPLFTPLTVSFLGLVSVLVLSGGALGLFWVIYKKKGDGEVGEELAWTLVSVEDMSSGLALITGFLGVVACVVSLSSGFRGVGFVSSLAESGVEPYATGSSFGLPVVYVSGVALVAGIAVVALSVYASDSGGV